MENINCTYNEFINNIIESRGQFGITSGYFERHHIIPKCMGGTGNKRKKDKNIIWLYAEEHFIAHKLLALENPNDYKLVSAWHMMAFPKGNTKRDFEISAEDYALVKKMRAEVQSVYRKKVGWPKSEESKKKYRENKLGDKNPMKKLMGENHPKYNKVCYSSPDETESKYFIEGEQPENWIKGMHYNFSGSRVGKDNPAYGRKWVNKDGKNKYCTPEELADYLNNGWKLGMIKKKKSKDNKRGCKK